MGELSQEARDEIAAAIKIARSDGLHVHKSYPAFLKAQQAEKSKPADNTPPEGSPPPVKDKPEADEYEEVVGLWGTKKVKKAKTDALPS